MKIIKVSTLEDLDKVAIYMINVMAQCEAIGPNGEVNADVKSDKGFPMFEIHNTEYFVKATQSILYYNDELCDIFNRMKKDTILDQRVSHENINEFLIKDLGARIEKLSNPLFNLPSIDYFGKYQMVGSYPHTSIKIKHNIQKRTAGPKKKPEGKFVVDCSLSTYDAQDDRAKFKWLIYNTRKMSDCILDSYEHNNEFVSSKIASIFLDCSNMTIYEKDTFVLSFGKKDFAVHKNLITAKVVPLTKFCGNLIAYFNNRCQNIIEHHHETSISKFCRDLEQDVYEVEYDPRLFMTKFDDAQTEKVENSKEELHTGDATGLLGRQSGQQIGHQNDHQTELDHRCEICKSQLYGEAYVLFNRKCYNSNDHLIETPNSDKLVTCCICLHMSLLHIENEYHYLFRVKIPVSVDNIIDMHFAPSVHKEALHVLSTLMPHEIEILENESIVLRENYAIYNMAWRNGSENYEKVLLHGGYDNRKLILVNITNNS